MRRGRAVLVTGSVLVALGGLGEFAAVAYQPFTPVAAPLHYEVAVLTSSGHLAAQHVSSGPASHPVWNEPVGEFRVEMMVTLYNNGPFPVTVTSIGSTSGAARDVHAFFDTLGAEGLRGGDPLRPFSLTGHNQQTIAVHWRQACRASLRERVVLNQNLNVSFSFLGHQHTVRVYAGPFALRLTQHC